MAYEIVAAPAPRSRKWKYAGVDELMPGEAFLVPYTDLTDNEGHAVRSIAWHYSKKLGRRFCTRKDRRGVWLIREA